jgi:hypothetical protein
MSSHVADHAAEAEPSREILPFRPSPLGWVALAACALILVSIIAPWATALGGILSADGTHGDIPTVAISALGAAFAFYRVITRHTQIALVGALVAGIWAGYEVGYQAHHLTASPLVSLGWGLFVCGIGAAGVIVVSLVALMRGQHTLRR